MTTNQSGNNNTGCIRACADIKQINACRKEIQKVNESINELSKVLSLAGNDVRMKILYLINKEGELCVCDLSDILNMSVPAISQHLRKMKDGDIIRDRKDGQTIYYSLKTEKPGILEPLFKLISKTKKLEEVL
ncbi:MAG: transcriptional regulator [Bacteroidetes bacterium]|nr:MAG: transcriptional regulator [Bacteroidota bacterium]